MHHRREGHLLTQQQEEMVLIAGFALFWMGTFLVLAQQQEIYHEYLQRRCWHGVHSRRTADLGMARRQGLIV